MKIQTNKILAGLLLLGLFCGLAMAAPSITGHSPDNSSSVTGTVGDIETLTVTLNESGKVIWKENGSESTVATDGENKSTLDHTIQLGSYKVIATVEGTNQNIIWDVEGTAAPEFVENKADFDADPKSGDAPLEVQFTDKSTNATTYLWDFGDGNNSEEKNPKHTYTKAGVYNVTLTSSTEGENSNTTKKTDYITVKSTTEFVENIADFDADPKSGDAHLEVQFTDKSTNATTYLWDFGDGNNSEEKNPKHTYTKAGVYNVTLTSSTEGENSNTTKKTDYITVKESSPGPSEPSIEITKHHPEIDEDEELIIVIGESGEFNITIDQACTVTWIVNGEEEEPEDAVEKDGEYYSSFNYTFDEIKNYNITAIAKNETTEEETLQIWDPIKVVSKNFESGNRIWDEDAGLSTTYTWDALSYSGFFYDLDTGDFSEKLTIKNIGRNIDEGDVIYSTAPLSTDFEYDDWGKYQVIGFMAQKYFAGFVEDDAPKIINDDVSLINEGVLSRVLIDTDDKKSIYSNSDLVLEDGYSLNIVEVDVNGDKVWVQLEKDGDVVEDQFLTSGDNFVYETDLGDAEDVPIIIVHFGTVFSGQETSAVHVDGVFQISDNYLEIEDGQEFGKMEVTSMSSDEIVMKNEEDDINLDEGDTIELMGKIKILVADDNTLRFAPVLDMSEAGKYELRGTVYDAGAKKTLKWDPFNFEGFYYNMDEGIGTENLTILEKELDGREIDNGGLVYRTAPQEVEFEHREWGKFQVIGFMAEKFFAGYTENTKFTGDDISLLSDNVLSEVLIDSDEKESMSTGSALILEEGYSLEAKEVDINGDKVWVQLLKDGDEVEDAFLSSGDTYVYENDLGDAEDIPQIIVNFGTVFAGRESSAVYVEGIFQISDKYMEIEDGDPFREMEVTEVGKDGITMKNDDEINLKEDDTIDLMGDVKIKVADDDTLRFYPFVEVETEGDGAASRELRISVPDEIFVDDEFEIEVTADKKAVEAVTVKLDGKSIGKTDEDGVLAYTSSTTGDFKLSAEKDAYSTANKNIEILEQKEEMSISVSPETAYEGDRVTIEVVKAIGGDAVEGAEVSVDGDSIGMTGSDGTIAYTANDAGRLSISAVKEGFLDEDITFNVKALEAVFTYSNLVVPPEVKAEKEAEISVNVENTGNAAGETEVELRVNGSFVDSQIVTLGIGENVPVTFQHVEEVPGTYTVEVGDQTTTYEVTKKSSVVLYALAVLILAIGGGAAYMFTKGGMTVADLQDKIAELTGKKNN